MAALRQEAPDDDPAYRAALMQYEGRLRSYQALSATLPDGPDSDDEAQDLADRLGDALRRGNDVERDVVLTARAQGTVSPAAADEVLRDVESRAARLA